MLSEAGQRMATYAYTDFGETSVSGSWGGAVKNHVLYTGGMYDSETEQYYLNARFYDPEAGRFLTQDSCRGEQMKSSTWNLYVYCAGNPINYIDPTGHFWKEIGGGLARGFKKSYTGIVDGVKYIVDDPKGALKKHFSLKNMVKRGLDPTGGFEALFHIGKGAWERDWGKVGEVYGGQLGQASQVVIFAGAGKIGGAIKFKVKGVSKGGGRACFVAGTLIATENGLRPIEEVKVGQLVYSENPETGEKGLKKVVRTFIHDKDKLLDIYTGETKIEATEEHPFWVIEKGWVLAGELEEGDKLLRYSGKTIDITKLKWRYLEEPVKVYNFEVEDFHTYYVGNNSILVHNTCETPSSKSKKFTKMRGNQGWKDKSGNTWKKDQLHKDHWDISNSKGKKVQEVDFNGNIIWPGGPKNKNK